MEWDSSAYSYLLVGDGGEEGIPFRQAILKLTVFKAVDRCIPDRSTYIDSFKSYLSLGEVDYEHEYASLSEINTARMSMGIKHQRLNHGHQCMKKYQR
jgi:hypothetical protein